MTYVDGFIVAVPKANKEKYIEYAKFTGAVFKENGALQVIECWEDDVPEGELTSFPLAVKREQDEAICFSWITWPSKEIRDSGMQKSMDDPRFDPTQNPMPFDGKRMIFGGFKVVLDT